MAGTTQNGWPIDPARRTYQVPGSQVSLSLINDTDVANCLLWAASVFNNKVQALNASQCGGYDARPIGGLGGTTSNHRSGTAIDLNYTNFPQGADRMTAAQKQVCRAIISASGGVLRWGGDYTGGTLLDQQHFEINTTDRGAIGSLIGRLRSSAATMPSGGSEADVAFGSPSVVASSAPTGPATRLPSVPMTQLTRQAFIEQQTNRLGAVRVAGLDMSSDISGSVVDASMSFSATQIGQLSMTIADTGDAFLLASGMFGPGTTIDWADQHMEVRTIQFQAGEGGPQLVVKARSRVISALRGEQQQGRASWGSMDVTAWVLDRCDEVGAIPVVQGGFGELVFARQQTDGTVETTWDVMTAAARNVGAWCYEFQQILTFARPTFLVSEGRARRWELWWNSHGDYSPGLTGFPDYSWSADSNPPGQESITFGLVSGDADLARPGDRVVWGGNVGMATGLWVVTDVTLPLTVTEPVQITAVRAIDPPLIAQSTT